MSELERPLDFRDFSKSMILATTIAFSVITGLVGTMIYKAGKLNERFDAMSNRVTDLEVSNAAHHTKITQYDQILVNMATDVCELRALAAKEPITPCQQIRLQLSQ